MDFTYLLKERSMSMYECSKRSGIPYSTLSDIMKGETLIERVSARNLNSLARTLEMTMDSLYSRLNVPERTSFETFKSQVRHELKRLGDKSFIIETLESDMISNYWRWEWYFEAFYLLAMVDYLCRINGIERPGKYDDLREYKLPEIVYPMDINVASKFGREFDIREVAVKESIPEFMQYNIVEKEIRDVY